MTDRPGDALQRVHNENVRRRDRLSNARRNEIARREKVYHGELRADELIAERDRLKREFYERHPELGRAA